MDNLELQYDQVLNYLDGYRLFVGSISSRVIQLPLRHPMKYLRLLRDFGAIWRQINLLSGRNSEFTKKWGMENATDEEKGNEYYSTMVSDYPLHELSLALESKFPVLNFDKLKKLHELKKGQISRLNLKQMIGVVLAAATILLKSIPESVVKRVVDYSKFELIIFLTASGAIGYLFLILLPLWTKYNRAKRVHDYANDVLEYASIRKSQNANSST